MLIVQGRKMIFIGAMLSCIGFSSSVSSRLWKATPNQIANDYGSIFHNRGNGDVVNIIWLAAPTTTASSQMVAILEKYVLIAVVHSHTNFSQQPVGTTFDDIKTLDVRDEDDNPLTPASESEVPLASVGLLAGFEAGYRKGFGPRGNGMKFFLFDARTVRACEKGGISAALDGETYTWETPFPGCPQ